MAEEDRYKPLKQFSQVIDMIERSYVRDVGREELIQGAIKGMLKSLDPHSAYLDKDAFQEMQVETTGEFTGVGIEITIQNGRLTVVSPIEGTPAFEAGLKAGDVILEIDGEPTQDISIMDAVHKIRGPKGTEVELTILHKDANAPKKIKVKRDVIPVHTTKSRLLEQGYLYVRITNFNENTTDELRKALEEHEDELKGVVLDLRNNPGGLLKQAVSVADIFLREGKIVYTKGKVDQAQMNFSADREPSDLNVPMTVIINSGTASASEIVAGALQDQQRALIVGERSFGKGSVQTVIPLVDGSGIKLTTALYYTPDGRSIQAAGIEPDIRVPLIQSGEDGQRNLPMQIFREKDLEGHLENNATQQQGQSEESEKEVSQLLKDDNQLNIALQLVKSLPVIQDLQ
jgi:carboxyl-terminal processing protease